MPYDYFIWNDESEIMRRVGVPSRLSSPQYGITFTTGQSPECRISRLSSSQTLPLIHDLSRLALGVFGFKLLAAAVTRVHEPLSLQLGKGLLVEGPALALDAFAVVMEPEPREVFVDAFDVCGAHPALVVVLDAQMNLEIPLSCGSPDVERGEQMPFV
jgi:hypothetical protein